MIRVRVAGSERWAAVEDAARLRDALGTALPPGVPAPFLESVSDDPLGDLLNRYARTHAPFTAADAAARLGVGPAVAQEILARLPSVIEGEFTPGRTGSEWVDTDVLRLLRRRSLARLRAEVEPSPPESLARFLPRWQGVGSPRGGPDALYETIERLQGVPLPVSALETLILPSRVPGYTPALLDELTSSGEILWVGRGALPNGDGRISLHPADTAPLLLPPPPDLPSTPRTPLHQALLTALSDGSALFFPALATRVRSTLPTITTSPPLPGETTTPPPKPPQSDAPPTPPTDGTPPPHPGEPADGTPSPQPGGATPPADSAITTPPDSAIPSSSGGTTNPPADGVTPARPSGATNPPTNGAMPSRPGSTANPPVDDAAPTRSGRAIPSASGGTANPPADDVTPPRPSGATSPLADDAAAVSAGRAISSASDGVAVPVWEEGAGGVASSSVEGGAASALGGRGALSVGGGEVTDREILEALWELVWAGRVSNDTLGPVRAAAGGAGRPAPRARVVRRGRGRVVLPSRTVPPAAAGRWWLVPAPEDDPTRRAHALSEVLLQRYGIVLRGAVAAERVPGGFAGLYPVLRAQEESGHCRRGYFVAGLGAAQFALPEAVDLLRSLRAPALGGGGAAIVLAAEDPANPYGAALPWPEGRSGHRPGRKAGAFVVLVDGALTFYAERGGKTLLTWNEDGWQAGVQALAQAVREGALDQITVERADGEPITGSPLGRLLEDAGFHPTPRGVRLRR